MLTKFRHLQFACTGDFDRDLTITEPLSQKAYVDYGQHLLKEPVIQKILGLEVITQIGTYFERFTPYFPNEQETNLVHADYDPANILVVKKHDEWQLSGILDWEFAFFGSSLSDVANMLRYAHQMPTWFEEGFLDGLERGGYRLARDWRTSMHLLNLLSLLDCLIRSSDKHPNQRKDICLLIDYILLQLNQRYF